MQTQQGSCCCPHGQGPQQAAILPTNLSAAGRPRHPGWPLGHPGRNRWATSHRTRHVAAGQATSIPARSHSLNKVMSKSPLGVHVLQRGPSSPSSSPAVKDHETPDQTAAAGHARSPRDCWHQVRLETHVSEALKERVGMAVFGHQEGTGQEAPFLRGPRLASLAAVQPALGAVGEAFAFCRLSLGYPEGKKCLVT